jgi:hypothetical protein
MIDEHRKKGRGHFDALPDCQFMVGNQFVSFEVARNANDFRDDLVLAGAQWHRHKLRDCRRRLR